MGKSVRLQSNERARVCTELNINVVKICDENSTEMWWKLISIFSHLFFTQSLIYSPFNTQANWPMWKKKNRNQLRHIRSYLTQAPLLTCKHILVIYKLILLSTNNIWAVFWLIYMFEKCMKCAHPFAFNFFTALLSVGVLFFSSSSSSYFFFVSLPLLFELVSIFT